MILQINDKEYEVYFGIAFVRALDEKYSTPGAGGAKFGIGLETMISKLFTGDTVALSEILYAGTASEKTRPTSKIIDQYIDEHPDIDGLFEEVFDELKKHNATKRRALKVLETLEKNAEDAEEK